MKLMHFHFGKDGGAERFFVHLLNAFAEREVEQTVFMRPDREWKKNIDARVQIHEGTFRRISLTRFFLAHKLKRLMKQNPPDALMAWMPRASRFMPDWPHCIKVARLGDYPLRLDYFERIDVLVCNTPGIAERVLELGWKRRVEVISNFTTVKTSPPVSRKSLDTPEDAFVILGVGRFVHRKGFHTLIEALAKTEDTILWLVGDGEERENLQTLAKTLGVSSRIRWAGWQADAFQFLASCDAFCMPSLHEPLGNVILEAWGVGKPVISSLSEGPTWMMKEGVDGLLYKVGDAGALAVCLERVRNDATLRATIAEGGKATLAAKFSKQGVTDAYLKLFSSKP